MPLTKPEFEEIVRLVCPHCRGGHPARVRPDTGEYVHSQSSQQGTTGSFNQQICWADGFQRSHFASELVADETGAQPS